MLNLLKKIQINNSKKNPINFYFQESLLLFNLHWGSVKSSWNMKISSYFLGIKNNLLIFNALQLILYTRTSVRFLIEYFSLSNQKILFLPNTLKFEELISTRALALNQPYVNDVWIYGLISNFKYIRTQKFKFYESYNKIWQYRMESYYHLYQLPKLLFTIDSDLNSLALKEGRIVNIPSVGILNETNLEKNLTYFFLGNNNSVQSILFYFELFEKSYLYGQNKKKFNFIYKTILSNFFKISHDRLKVKSRQLFSYKINLVDLKKRKQRKKKTKKKELLIKKKKKMKETRFLFNKQQRLEFKIEYDKAFKKSQLTLLLSPKINLKYKNNEKYLKVYQPNYRIEKIITDYQRLTDLTFANRKLIRKRRKRKKYKKANEFVLKNFYKPFFNKDLHFSID